MSDKKLIVGITQGDSNGIGYEVIIKALSDPRILDMFTPVIYGSSKIFGFYRKTIPEIEQMDTNLINNAREAHARRINILGCLPDNAFAEPGGATAASAQAAISSLERAVKDLKEGAIDVLVTGPINKKAIVAEGFGFPGHTEYLEQEFGVKDVTMFLISERLKVGVVTGHIPLKDVPAAITEERILSKLRLMNESLKKDFRVATPQIAVLSLNPHSGDSGLLGDEERMARIEVVDELGEVLRRTCMAVEGDRSRLDVVGEEGCDRLGIGGSSVAYGQVRHHAPWRSSWTMEPESSESRPM